MAPRLLLSLIGFAAIWGPYEGVFAQSALQRGYQDPQFLQKRDSDADLEKLKYPTFAGKPSPHLSLCPGTTDTYSFDCQAFKKDEQKNAPTKK